MSGGRPLVTVVVPVYGNQDSLAELDRLIAANAVPGALPGDVETIYVDDGSPDRSLDVLRGLAAAAPERVRVLRLSRNFGSHAAILAGLSRSRGRYVAMVSADLQDDPGMIARMLDAARTQGAEVVLAVRGSRDEEASKVAFANFYYWLMRKLSHAEFPPGGFDCFLIARPVVRALVDLGEANTSITALILWMGFRRTTIEVQRKARLHGKSRWTLRKKVRLVLDSVISFSHAPVRLMEILGLLSAAAGLGYAAFIVGATLLGRIERVDGWASLMVVLLVMSGLVLASLGVVGEYLWRILDASRRRPVFVVAEEIGGAAEGNGE